MKKLAYLILLLLISSSVWAQQAFVVRAIQIQGSERLTPATVENYIPIKRGQTLQPSKTSAILTALYNTGFFEQVSLSRSGNTLIIHVIERPMIGRLKVSGNSVIPTDKLTSVMKSLNVAEGRVYNASVLEKIKQSLLNQYYQLGRYNARVDVKVTPMPRHRVAIDFAISEGLTAKVRHISIIGNHVFSENTLVSQMDLTTGGYLTFITQTDRYAEEKLDSSLDKIRAYYMDRGYLKFEVKSAQAQVTPDRKAVYITIVISEGEQYKVSQVNLTGNLILAREDIMKYVSVKPGEVFSRQKVIDSQKTITQFYGNKGYMFASVNVLPQINEAAHLVALTFDIKPGKRTYVRQVTFSDNNHTNDVVLRREVQQLEAAPASSARLEESKQRLLLLPYVKEADVSVKPVPGVDDQVDINYKVKEQSSAQASLKLGLSQNYGLILGAGFNQNNFLGTGNSLGINFSRSKYEQFYGVDYTDPYYTEDGISRSFNFSISRVNPSKAGGDGSYTTNSYNGGVLYTIPIGQEKTAFSRLIAGLSYQNLLVHLTPKNLSNQVNAFVTDHGRHYQEADFKLGISRDSRDRAIFPTRGSSQSLFLDAFAPLASGSVAFYTLNYAGRFYQPIYRQFIFTSRLDLGYGNGLKGIADYPFFKNYYAGGINSVAGYEGFSLGPLDSRGRRYGGNILGTGMVGVIFPNYISDSLRTTLFVNGGNVYTSLNNRSFGGASTDSGPIRYAVGVQADWFIPMIGPISISLAKPLNLRKGDEQKIFDFSMGMNF